jgi:hypothetical protein
LWVGRLSSLTAGRSGSHYYWLTLEPGEGDSQAGEIAIKYDEDSQRHYLLIAEGGQGKLKTLHGK